MFYYRIMTIVRVFFYCLLLSNLVMVHADQITKANISREKIQKNISNSSKLTKKPLLKFHSSLRQKKRKKIKMIRNNIKMKQKNITFKSAPVMKKEKK